MPLNRYQIRNEYSLADPELYKVANKDDPEALLEGVAMSGLVGVLRQLGDLAQFAAEIFHDLHEEVMATAARSHGLIVRVQQLEAELPSIERTLLSQTSHTSFLYSSGNDWHPNIRMDQSLVTRGDLPRFVMDSYEECRGPPRLFLLDKFDVAGAGACLKRFTDPSFFKIDSASSTSRKLDGQREKKTRRVKKRGPRLRNGDTPESFPSSHAKLHQLFLEERIESGDNDPARRVKLKKRQFTGSLFVQDNARSYMEKFLDTSQQEQKILHEICIDPLALTWTSDNVCEADLEIVEIGTMSPVKEPIQTDRSLCSSPDAKIVVKSSINDFYQDKLNITSDTESMEVPGLGHESHDDDMSTITKVVNGEEIADTESKLEVSVHDACDFDDGASEIDNYVDALANIDSEVDTDYEFKKNTRYLNLKPIVADSDGSERQRELPSVSLDSQSVGNSATSEDGYFFSKERESSSCSNSLNTVTETTPDLDTPVVAVSTIQSNSDSGNMSFDHLSTSEEILRKEREKHAAASTDHSEFSEILKSEQESGEASNSSSLAHLEKKPLPVDMNASLKENLLTDLGEIDQWHANQSAVGPSHRLVSDTEQDNGNCFSVEPSIHDDEGQNSSIYSDMSCAPSNIAYGLVHSLETDTHSSVRSLVEGHEKDLTMADNDACSDSEPPGKHLTTFDPSYLEKTKPIYVAHEQSFASSTDANSTNLYSFSDSTAIRELLPGATILGRTSSLGSAVGNLPWSSKYPSVEDNAALSDERVSSAALGDQAETLPANSNQLQTCTQNFSTSKITDAAEIIECGPLKADSAVAASFKYEPNSELSGSGVEKIADGSLLIGTQLPDLGPLETQHEWLNNPSEATDTTLLELHQDGACKEHPENDTCTDDNNEALHVLLLENKPVFQDFNSIYPDETKAFEPDTLVDDPACQAASLLDETSIDHATADQHDDEDLTSSHDASSLIIPFKHAAHHEYVSVAENDTDLSRDVEKVEHVATGTDGYHQNGITLSLPDGSLPEVVNKSRNLAETAPLACENNSEHLELTSSHQTHLLEAEDLDPLGHDFLRPQDVEQEKSAGVAALNCNDHAVSKTSPQSAEHTLEISSEVFHLNGMLNGANQSTQVENTGQPVYQQDVADLGMRSAELRINLEPPSLPPLPPMQWRQGRFRNSAAAPAERNTVQHTLVPAQVQPMNAATMHHTLAPVQLMTLPTVHHTLAPFQSATLPTTLPAVQYAVAPLHPVTLPTSDIRTETIARTFTNEGQLGHSDGYLAQQGFFALPMPVSVSEGFFQTNTSAVGRQGNSPPTVTSTSINLDDFVTQQGIFTAPMPAMVSEGSSQPNTIEVGRQDNVQFTVSSSSTQLNDAQIIEESCQASADQPELGSLADAETTIHNELPAHASQVPSKQAENAHIQPILSSRVDQPTPGLLDSEVATTWSSAYDRDPTHVDGSINGALQKKPPRPRNPLIDEVVAIDKSKFRKVERTKPQLESKPEEGESILEQLQLRKVERVKPPVESKVEGGEYLLEQLQLRKVGERVKPPVELKADDEFIVEHLQLRKVGERIKPAVEQKSEEREFLLEQLQLRKVGEKTKQEVEPKVDETGSPLAHLRKVRERVREELEPKAEETESPRMRLRKVTERAHPLVGENPEERDSLFEQIRNKSFSLKPAVATRPNIQGPRTNLNVAAILEKASTIRQAMAGSDEDDDADSWSDS